MQALGPEDVVRHGAPWALSEARIINEFNGCSATNIAHVDESEICRQFDSEVIDERKSTSDRIKEASC